jgi:hypothetical protein
MNWSRHRLPLALAAGLDAAGLIAAALIVNGLRQSSVADQQLLLFALVLIYLSLGWLFGSYTLLKLARLRWMQLLLRLGITSTASIVAGALLGWLLRVPPGVTLLHRGSPCAVGAAPKPTSFIPAGLAGCSATAGSGSHRPGMAAQLRQHSPSSDIAIQPQALGTRCPQRKHRP